jgi:hypothetical protein
MDREPLFYRSPVAVGDEESRSVPGLGGGDWRVFVQNLEAIELDDIIVLMLHVGIQLAEGELLETSN